MNIKYDIVPYSRGQGIQVLSENYPKLYDHFVGASDEKHSVFASGVMDFVVACKVNDFNAEKWFRVIKQDGYLVSFQKSRVLNINANIVVDKQIDGFYYQVFQKSDIKETVKSQLKPTVCVVRYGGFGDMIQISSVLPGLKKQGYHVTVNTDSEGYNIIKKDPNLDDVLLQDKDQVPNHELGAYWEHLATKYDKLINLSESVEGSLLVLPGRISYSWPHTLRHERLNINYLEFTHKIAEVPMPPQQKFYATIKEKAWAQKQRKKMDAKTIILWVLSGSSVHKTWPYLDTMLARLLLMMNIKVVLIGDEVSQVLETGWENEPRVIKKCGKWSIRETLAFAEISDIVIGPETGVLNAVGRVASVAKIVCLSHSSQENLSKYWENCISLEPEGCPCWPCHRMCYGFDPCIQDEKTGVALCQAKISSEQMWAAINKCLEENK